MSVQSPVKIDKVSREIEVYLNIEEADTERFRMKYNHFPKEMEMSIQEKTKNLTLQFGEVYFVNLGYNVGSEIDKVRPVIVCSHSETFNHFSKLVTVVPITNSQCKYPSQFEIGAEHFKLKDDAYKDTRPVTGVAKAEQIRSVSKGRFLYKMGELTDKGKEELKSVLKLHMGL